MEEAKNLTPMDVDQKQDNVVASQNCPDVAQNLDITQNEAAVLTRKRAGEDAENTIDDLSAELEKMRVQLEKVTLENARNEGSAQGI